MTNGPVQDITLVHICSNTKTGGYKTQTILQVSNVMLSSNGFMKLIKVHRFCEIICKILHCLFVVQLQVQFWNLPHLIVSQLLEEVVGKDGCNECYGNRGVTICKWILPEWLTWLVATPDQVHSEWKHNNAKPSVHEKVSYQYWCIYVLWFSYNISS